MKRTSRFFISLLVMAGVLLAPFVHAQVGAPSLWVLSGSTITPINNASVTVDIQNLDAGALSVDGNVTGDLEVVHATATTTISDDTGDSVLSSTGSFVFSPIGGNIYVDDDISYVFGSGDDAKLRYETADANANALTIVLPESSATNIPVLVLGDATIDGTNVGFFDGYTDPGLCIVSDSGLQRGCIVQGTSFLTAKVQVGFAVEGTSGQQIRQVHNGTNAVWTSSRGGHSLNGGAINAGLATSDSYVALFSQTINDTTTGDGTAGKYRGVWIDPTLTDTSAFSDVAYLTMGRSESEHFQFFTDGRFAIGSAQGGLETYMDAGDSYFENVNGANDMYHVLGADTDVFVFGYDNGTFYKGFEVQNSANQVNYIITKGSATGQSAQIGATGSDSDVDLTLYAKGTQSAIVFSLSSALSDVSADGFTWYPTATSSYTHEAMDSDVLVKNMTIKAQDAFQNAGNTSFADGANLVLKAGNSNLLHTGSGGNGGDIDIMPGEASAAGPNGGLRFFEHENSDKVSAKILSTGANADLWVTNPTSTQAVVFGYFDEDALAFGNSVRISHVHNQVNYLNFSGNIADEFPTIATAGDDTNIGLVIDPKGTAPIVANDNIVYESSDLGTIYTKPDSTCAIISVDNSNVVTATTVTCP